MHRLTARAPAKINLTLRVLGRRADGFHDLVSLVVFAGTGDLLHLDPDAPLGLGVTGRTAPAAGPAADNLVLRAATEFAAQVPGARLGGFLLEKRLPVAAGLGGGSADAAAALRLLAQLNDLPTDDPRLFAAAQEVGSDVPACLDPRARIMRGRGEMLSAPLRIPALACVLVNCGAAVPTAPVFKGLGLAPGAVLPGPDHPDAFPGDAEALLAAIRALPNDLEPPALALAPAIGAAKVLLAAGPQATLVRMSGSGATVFALTADCRTAAALARRVKTAEPSWWVKPTMLR
ncbi:4-(cytidine 5'-diphospho)-2-C-methyl-D-erythritol kinase [Xanthobacter pseudotagetidis]|uniref:4-(cytidine 5'-diphospho)-2-C-methyl-D-erythritol kinase n=1 Tax=Xanthobacter pseudotagetidis TaxID=3119911 RepID=UPI0037269F22